MPLLSRLNLCNKLLLVIGIFVIVFISFSSVNFLYIKGILVQENQARVMARIEKGASEIDGFFKEKARSAWTFCLDPEIQYWLETNTQRRISHRNDRVYQQMIQQFKRIVENDPQIKSVFIASEKTQEYFDHAERDPGADYYVGQRPWYQDTVEAEHPIYDIDYDLLDGNVYAAYQNPIYNENKQLLGIGGLDISIETIETVLADLKLFKSSLPFLVAKDGTFLFHPDEEMVLKKKITDLEDSDKYHNVKDAGLKMIAGESGCEQITYEGQDHYLAFTSIQILDATLALSIPKHEMDQALDRVIRNTMLSLFAILLLMILGTVYVANSVANPIRRLTHLITQNIQDKDLTTRIPVKSIDEAGELASAFNEFMDTLEAIILNVKTTAQAVGVTVKEMDQTSEMLGQGAKDQTERVNQVVTSAQEISLTVRDNAKNAVNAADAAEQAQGRSKQGFDRMVAIEQEMDQIVSSAEMTEQIVRILADQAAEIDEIIRVIHDVMEQTGILSINASIEAVKAGELGSGFSVVAEEIQSLATRTDQATNRITEVIHSVQENVKKTSESISTVYQLVSEGKEHSIQSKETFESIVLTVTHSTELIRHIATVSEQQCREIDVISEHMKTIQTVTNQSQESASELNLSSSSLNAEMRQLNDLVGQFTTKDQTPKTG
ncbi:methyl-accepting chemotaxis protein [candidate division KSB1 bacterium]|nr:methyl-accepting chemotaxis protein [candidate division KSB1 bacterium]